MIDSIWYFDGTMTFARERVFPDGLTELVVQLDEVHRDGSTGERFPAVCINGLRTRAAVVEAPGSRCRIIGIRFAPRGACAVLATSVAELLDATVDLRVYLNRWSDELAERCSEAAQLSTNPVMNADAVVAAAAFWAAQRLSGACAIDPLVQWIVGEIRTRAAVSVETLQQATGLSRSRFAQRFRIAVGVTPKRYARIVRFSRALARLGDAPIAEVALEHDFYDQSHMYADFCEFAGMAPGAFLAAKRYPGSASLAEP